MQDISLINITTDTLSLPLLSEKNIEADVLRLDKIHPLVSGNKWFKLRYYLEDAKKQSKKNIATYGGAWSNHILATAAACKINNLNSIGIIRGEEPVNYSQTLAEAKGLGMQLIFTSRQDYKNEIISEQMINSGYYIIPQGGYGIKGAEGAATILDYCKKEDYTHICCAAGTGTMTAGLIKNSLPHQKIISISVLKNNYSLEEEIISMITTKNDRLEIIHDYHFGGYAKHKQELFDFMNDFYSHSNIPSDFVYTGKLLFAVNDMVSHDFFPQNSKLLLIHSGGLQGNTSLSKGTLIF